MDEALEQQENFLDYFQTNQDYDEEEVERQEEIEPEEEDTSEDDFMQNDEMDGEAFLQTLLSGDLDGFPMGDYAAPMFNTYGTASPSKAGGIANMISRKESEGQGGYEALPRRKDGSLASSAVGKYQFLWDKHGDWISNLTGVHSKEEFQHSPEAQEAAFDHWDKTTLTPQARKYASQLPQYSEDQIKMMIHFGGSGNVEKAIKSGNFDKPLDSFGSSLNSYLKKRQYGGDLEDPIQPVPKNSYRDSLAVYNRSVQQANEYRQALNPRNIDQLQKLYYQARDEAEDNTIKPLMNMGYGSTNLPIPVYQKPKRGIQNLFAPKVKEYIPANRYKFN